ncbi:unnamed protein product [Effrenium voratum]|nr:unnamed protein product [Effrenium voratum]
MAEALEPLLPEVCSFAQLTEVLSAAAVARHWRQASRSDQVWIQCCRQRWHFGRLFEVEESLDPGARDEASLRLWQRSVEEYKAGVKHERAFGFFLGRCKKDEEVRQLLQQAVQDVTKREEILQQLPQMGANILDILLKLEAGQDAKLRSAARLARIHITDAWAQQRWAHLIKVEPAKAAVLEEGAFVLSQWGYPAADVHRMRQTLEQLAARATQLGARREGEGVPTQAEVRRMVGALNQALYQEFGLAGNQSDYYNPENSMLHAVLMNKKGIPISLSVVWAAVAGRCGLVCHPLANVPRHVLIRIPARAESGPAETQDMYLDAFDHGQLMDWPQLRDFLLDLLGLGMVGHEVHLPQFVAITPPALLYLRMMRNLENIYGQRGRRLVRQ